jgi:hypothetical protein
MFLSVSLLLLLLLLLLPHVILGQVVQDACQLSMFVNQVSGYGGDVCKFMGLFGDLVPDVSEACKVVSIINTASDIVDDVCTSPFVDSASGITYTPTTVITGVCTNYGPSVGVINPSGCPAITMDYDCASSSYSSPYTGSCSFPEACPISYTNKYNTYCAANQGATPMYGQEWTGLPSSCSFVPMVTVGIETQCASNYITVQSFNCTVPSKPVTILQFLNDATVDPISFATSNFMQFLSLPTNYQVNLVLVDSDTFNDPSQPFSFSGGDFFFYFDDHYTSNPNLNSTAVCKMVSITYLSSSGSALSPHFLGFVASFVGLLALLL